MAHSSFYNGLFGLKERPFSLVPDPEFIYWSPQHRRAYSILEFGILSRAPITMLTGEIGAGKTTLLQNLLARLGNDVTVGLVSNAQGSRGELLQWVLNALDVPFSSEDTYVQNFQLLQEHLIDEYAKGRRVVLIFDEAQNISSEGLEELRMLININSNKDELVQLILVGPAGIARYCSPSEHEPAGPTDLLQLSPDKNDPGYNAGLYRTPDENRWCQR